MNTIAGVIVGLSVLLNLAFVVRFGRPGRHPDKSMARYLASTGWQQLTLDTVLLVSLFGLHVSPWIALCVLAFGDVVAGWRLWLLERARREE